MVAIVDVERTETKNVAPDFDALFEETHEDVTAFAEPAGLSPPIAEGGRGEGSAESLEQEHFDPAAGGFHAEESRDRNHARGSFTTKERRSFGKHARQ